MEKEVAALRSDDDTLGRHIDDGKARPGRRVKRTIFQLPPIKLSSHSESILRGYFTMFLAQLLADS
jgi:hypothetical protein